MTDRLVCGLEVHVELSTRSKIFCSCATSPGAPNTRCCPVCTGQPGALPVLNGRALKLAILAGLATGCSINSLTRFDRKNYFYPDLPKAYQISQYDLPVCSGGHIMLESGKNIRIRRIHLEEDAGKLIHDGASTLIDYNRAGIPLIEIVSEPDISSAQEAVEYVRKLALILRYTGVSQCRMQLGQLRCDVNVSVSMDGAEGVRTEIKNINSLSHMRAAIEYEYSRQLSVLQSGGRVLAATMRYDEQSARTYVMRVKESQDDYRFFPEPDLPVISTGGEAARLRAALPELLDEKLARYKSEFALPSSAAELLVRYKNACTFFEEAVSLGAPPRHAANFIIGPIFSMLASEEDKWDFRLKITARMFADLLIPVGEGKLPVTAAQQALEGMLLSGKPYSAFVDSNDMRMVSREQLLEVCKGAIAANPKAVADFRSGKQKAIGGLFGYIRRATGGRADMTLAEELLRNLWERE